MAHISVNGDCLKGGSQELHISAYNEASLGFGDRPLAIPLAKVVELLAPGARHIPKELFVLKLWLRSGPQNSACTILSAQRRSIL